VRHLEGDDAQAVVEQVAMAGVHGGEGFWL
jgi:hypothetical protein